MRVALIGTTLDRVLDAGGATFLIGLTHALATVSDVQTSLVIPGSIRQAIQARVPTNVELIEVRPMRGELRVMRDLLGLQRTITRLEADVVHFPHEWCPKLREPTVNTIQNIAWLHPSSLPDTGLRGRVLRTLTSKTYDNANRWVAVSELAATLWARHVKVAKDDVAVIPEALYVDGQVESRKMSSHAPARHGHHRVLAITGAAPYKNAQLLIEAVGRLRRLVPDLDLTMVGYAGAGPPAGVTVITRCTRAELMSLMKEASLVIYPSRVESFGLPAFEATASGTPCIVLEGTPMSHLLRDAVIAVPEEPAALATAAATYLTTRSPSLDLRLPVEVTPGRVGAAWADIYRGMSKS